jgi:hypothetical protein
MGGWRGEVKTKGFIKTRVKDSIKPSALVCRVDRWAEGEGKGGV